ncbi:hypothetical protein [Arthrobacter sp. R4-81]
MDHAQRVAAEIALSVLSEDGFLLAGGQALAEHGVIDCVSTDVDLLPCTESTPRNIRSICAEDDSCP